MGDVTIKNIAKNAGVSIATVSRVINGNYPVSDELRQRVNSAIQELNYYPNSIARSLKTENTYTIGYVVSDICNPFFTVIMCAIDEVITPLGYNLMVFSTDGRLEKEMAVLRLLMQRKVEGIIINSVGGNEKLVSQISRTVPVIACNRKVSDPEFRGDFVDNDNLGGAFEMTKHLIDLGHRRIGIISGPMLVSTGEERFAGFVKAMRLIGVDVMQDYPYIYYGSFTDQDGYHGAQVLCSMAERPTALVIMNNEMAMGAMRYFARHNISIPEDMSFCLFGDVSNRELLYVKPTLAALNLIPLGNRIGEMMIERIESGNQQANREVRFTTHLLVGDTTRGLV